MSGSPMPREGYHVGPVAHVPRNEYGLTARQMETIRAIAVEGTNKGAGYVLGNTEQSVKSQMSIVYAITGAQGFVDLLRHIGWLQIPEEAA